MKFSYDLKINNKKASLTMEAPSMDSIASFYGFSGPTKEVEQIKKKVDWNTSVVDIVNKINSMHFCNIVSSSSSGEPVKEEVVAEEKISSEESSQEEEGQNSSAQGFRYSWSLDNEPHGEVVPASSDNEEADEEKVGD